MQEDHNHSEYFKMEFVSSTVNKSADFKSIAEKFSLLSDETRLKIFWILCHSKECVIKIAEMLNITTPAVSHHLKILKDSGLIESYRDGKEVFYSASTNLESKAFHSIIEDMMEMSCPDFDNTHEHINENSKYLENYVSTIKQIHDYLKDNLSQRFTIEDLAKKYAINTTTLKSVFKDVYGTSLAVHVKQHRMEKAAELLIKTDLKINEIASQVGYESQSKFTVAFKEFYKENPVDYRRIKTGANL